jgi:hypothetical protein
MGTTSPSQPQGMNAQLWVRIEELERYRNISRDSPFADGIHNRSVAIFSSRYDKKASVILIASDGTRKSPALYFDARHLRD